MQRLTGRLITLFRFLLRVVDTTKPFFKLLKKHKGINLKDECKVHFEKLKEFNPSPPILTRPQLGKDLILYLVVSKHVISSVVVVEEGKSRNLVYYISQVLKDEETWYQMIEKLSFALVITARRLYLPEPLDSGLN